MTTVDHEQELDLREALPGPAGPAQRHRKRGRARHVFMRPRKALVKVHRCLSLGLIGWIVIVALTGAWLVPEHRRDTSCSDRGPRASHHRSC